jgi:hypothetical protein
LGIQERCIRKKNAILQISITMISIFYERVRKGTIGFVCFIARNENGNSDNISK